MSDLGNGVVALNSSRGGTPVGVFRWEELLPIEVSVST